MGVSPATVEPAAANGTALNRAEGAAAQGLVAQSAREAVGVGVGGVVGGGGDAASVPAAETENVRTLYCYALQACGPRGRWRQALK